MGNSNLEPDDGFFAELRGGRADGTWHHSASPVDRLSIAYSDVVRGERWSESYQVDRAASRAAGHAVMINID